DTAPVSGDVWAGYAAPVTASSPLIGHQNCSSGEAHRRPITGEEVELGEEEPSGRARRSKKIEGEKEDS
ncbi:unnamed protein product, partial [Staurois parvus]